MAKRSVVVFLLVLGAFLPFGCSDDSTGPDQNPPPTLGSHLWSARFGDEYQQFGKAVAVDASGNVFIAGGFSGSIDLGGGALASAGDRDFFLAKFTSAGAHLWSKSFGNASDQWNPRIAVDASGNVIIAAGFEGAIDFGGGALVSAGSLDICVAKLGPDGAHFWSKRFGDSDVQAANGVAVDISENVIITGILRGTANFGGGALTSAGINDVFVAKFGSDGLHQWSARFGDANNQFPAAIAADASGNVIVTGDFQSAIDFGGGTLPSAGDYDIFVACFRSDGVHLWSKRFGDSSSQSAQTIVVAPSGSSIIAGSFNGNINFGGSALTSAGNADIFIAAFNASGAHLWSKRFGDSEYQCAFGVAVDISENVIITGAIRGITDFGGGALASEGDQDIFIAKFDAGGNHRWSKLFGDAEHQVANGIAVDISKNVIVTGGFMGAADFGGGPLTSAGSEDAFIAKFEP